MSPDPRRPPDDAQRADRTATTEPETTPVDATTAWTLHPDRGLPADPTTRAIAREILATTRGLPIVSMHGHVPVEWFADDRPFADPARLLVVPDHYLVRMLVSQGARVEQLGVAPVGTGTG
ncbi:MAG: hypothetical protein AAGC63_13505, partial [Propionicimonas sp.]